MAARPRKEGLIYDESILKAQEGHNSFFDSVSSKLAEKLGIGRTFIFKDNILKGFEER